jgi:hypothetical protein
MTNDGLDESWGYADPAQAAAAGIKVVSMYLSRDPSKNVTVAKVNAYHAHGIGALLNWEDQPGAPLKGAAQGRSDAAASVLQARGLNAPAGCCIYFSCDTDINPSQYKAINAYYRAAGKVVHAAGYLLGCYGEADLVAHLSAAGITDAEWQTLAWSGGRLDPAADFYQCAINGSLGGASVDFDRIIHPAQLGAWWPSNSPYSTPEEFTMDQEVQAEFDKIYNLLHSALSPNGPDGQPHQVGIDTIVARRTNPILAAVASPDQIAAAVFKKLPPASVGGLTTADVETAVRAVFADAGKEG